MVQRDIEGKNAFKSDLQSLYVLHASPTSCRNPAKAVFVLLLGPFTFFNAQKTKYLQILTSLMRWIAPLTRAVLLPGMDRQAIDL
ncbi:transmembrane protein 104 isoform X2 [Tachysurus ichikawai]